MSPHGLVFVAHVLVLLTAGSEVIHGLKFPFGPSAGDTGHLNQSTLGVAVPLPTNFTYFGEAQAEIYANEDGFLSFTKSGLIFDVDKDFGAITFPVICIFCADFKPRNEHKIWRRLSTQASDLQKVQGLSRKSKDFGAAFTPTWVFVVTWDEVGTFDPSKLGNTLQIAVANSAGTSLVFMEYDAINWMEGFTGTGDSINTKVGFTKGNQKNYFNFLQSGKISVMHLNISSNIGVDGQFLFRADRETIQRAPVRRASSNKLSSSNKLLKNTTDETVTKSPERTDPMLKASTTLSVVLVVVVVATLLSVAIVIFVKGKGKEKRTWILSPPSVTSTKNNARRFQKIHVV